MPLILRCIPPPTATYRQTDRPDHPTTSAVFAQHGRVWLWQKREEDTCAACRPSSLLSLLIMPLRWQAGGIQSCNLASPPGTGPILRGICCRGTVEGCGKQGSPTGQQHREGRPLLTFLYSILLFGSGVCHQVANFTTALEDYRTIELPPTQVDPLLPRPYVVYVV